MSKESFQEEFTHASQVQVCMGVVSFQLDALPILLLYFHGLLG